MGKKSSKQVEKPEEKEVFESLCGFDFDPSKKSDCFLECQKDNPESFKACLAHFSEKPIEKKKTAPSKEKRGKNEFGHLIGCQGDLIDRALLDAENPIKLSAIAEIANARTPRTRHHILHLKNDIGIDIRENEDGLFIGTKFKELVKKSKEFK